MAGDQTPEMPLGEVVSKAGAGAPAQRLRLVGKSGNIGSIRVVVTALALLDVQPFWLTDTV